MRGPGSADVVEVRLGRAIDTLPLLAGPFDLIFIDADKVSYPEYLQWAVAAGARGSVIVADNVVRKGAVIDADSSDQNVQGVRRFNEILAADARLERDGDSDGGKQRVRRVYGRARFITIRVRGAARQRQFKSVEHVLHFDQFLRSSHGFELERGVDGGSARRSSKRNLLSRGRCAPRVSRLGLRRLHGARSAIWGNRRGTGWRSL